MILIIYININKIIIFLNKFYLMIFLLKFIRILLHKSSNKLLSKEFINPLDDRYMNILENSTKIGGWIIYYYPFSIMF